MRIWIVTDTLSRTDGQGRVNLEIAGRLAAKGHQIVCVSSEIDVELGDAANVHWRPVRVHRRLSTKLARNRAFARKAKAIVSPDIRPQDILLSNGCNVDLPADVNIANFVHSEWLHSRLHPWHVRGGPYGAYQRLYTSLNARWEQVAFRNARRVVAVSQAVRQSLRKHIGVPDAAIDVIEPGVDAEEFRPRRPGEPNQLRLTTGVDARSFLMFFAGDIKSNRKNLDLVLRCMVECKDAHLAVAGCAAGSPYPEMAKRLGVGERVHFLGRRNDVASLLRGSDAFVFPSHYDTFALVVAEAMASGVAVITAPSVGASSLLDPPSNGLVLRHSDDLVGLVAAVRTLTADPQSVQAMGSAARKAAERATWLRMACRYESLFEKLAEEKRSNLNRCERVPARV